MLSAPAVSDRTSQCTTALQYATHLLPFTRYLHADHQLEATMLSLIMELPLTSETASVFAQFSVDVESAVPETQDTLCWILKEWEDLLLDDRQPSGGKVASGSMPRGQTLAAAYHEKVYEHEQVLDKKQQAFGAYHKKLFVPGDAPTENLLIGSRPFESCNDFLACLDMFYSISFGSYVETESMGSFPLIDAFASKIREAQLELVPTKVTKKPKFTRCVSVQSSQVKLAVMEKLDTVENTVCLQPKPSRIKCSLSRSRSESETDSNVGQKSPAILQHLSSQPAEIDDLMSRNGLDVTKVTALHDSITGMQNADSNNANTLRANPNPHMKAKHTTSLHSIDSTSNSDRIKPAFVDYLPKSVLPLATVERLKFDGDIAQTERLAECLSSWTMRHCAANNQARSSAIRVRVSPQLLAYSLWLIDSCQQFTPRVGDVTVAVVHSQTPASVPHEPSYSLALVDSGIVGNGIRSLQGVQQSGRTGGAATGQEVTGDFVKKGKKGRKKPKKTVRSDESDAEIANGVNGQPWSQQEIQASLSHKELAEPVNRSTNNNVDRCNFAFCASLNLSVSSVSF